MVYNLLLLYFLNLTLITVNAVKGKLSDAYTTSQFMGENRN